MKTPNKSNDGVVECWSDAVSAREHHSSTPGLQLSITPLLRWTLPALLICEVFSRCFAQCCPPVVTNQPQSQSVVVGITVNFSVGVSSATSPNYQWRFNGGNIACGMSTTFINSYHQPSN